MGSRLKFILAFALMSVALVAADKEHVAERFDVTATVQPDGSLEVVEVIAFRFTGDTYTTVTRDLRATESDGVEVIDASMDGRVLPRGEEEGQVEVDPERRRVHIEWHFAPAVDRVHEFTLRYRYKGVVRQGAGEDWFRWPPFPSNFDYVIEQGTARLVWPAAAQLRQQPAIEGPVSASGAVADGIELRVDRYDEDQDAVMLTVRFEPGVFPATEPQWERDLRRAQKMAPAFIAGGVMILAATVLALWLFFLRYRRDTPDSRTIPSVTSPPDALPPALAGSISRGRVSVSWPQLLAVVFDLARRGALHIEEKAGGGFLSRRKFVIRRGSDVQMRPHERALIETLFKPGETEERFDRALSRVGYKTRKIGKAIRSELDAERFIDPDRREGSNALAIGGIVVVVLAIALTIVLAATGMRLGPASLVIPGALAVAGLAMILAAATFSTLTVAGLRAAGQWAAYRRYLKDAIKQRQIPADGEAIGRMLPHAAALGLLSNFGRALQKIDVRNVPTWLRSLDSAGGSAAMMAVIVASSRSVSHGSGGGGGGGGVGAGGSSGAH